jgi:spoIIIJ-associated protein
VNDESDHGAEPSPEDSEAATRAVEAAEPAPGTGSAELAGAAAEASDSDDPDEDEGDGDVASDNPLDTEAEIAADYLEELLDIADLDGDIDTYIEGDRAHVSIVSESHVLVGPNGEVLDALQELTRLAVMTETGDRSRLMLDVAGYRERRRKELAALAADAVEEARSSQERVPLLPMNPFERKIVHDAVAAAGLSSESEGEEPRRHVVVLPA